MINKIFIQQQMMHAWQTFRQKFTRKPQETNEKAEPRKSDSNLHNSIGSVLLLAQCFALMPVVGIKSTDLSQIRFKWFSLRTIYSVANLCATIVLLIMNFFRYMDSGMHFGDIVTVVYYCAILCTILIFFLIAKKWHNFMQNWYSVEMLMRKYDYQPNLSRKFKLTMCTVMFLALVEHLLFVSKNIALLHMCSSFKTDPIRTYFGVAFAQIFSITSFTYSKAIILEITLLFDRRRNLYEISIIFIIILLIGLLFSIDITLLTIMFQNILATFAWNFMDLFVMLICSAMAQCFKQINKKIVNTLIHNEEFWKEIREDYNKLVGLCKDLDRTINHLISLCLFNDLFFITVQLFRTLNPLSGIINSVYFVCSFGFLLGRTAAVCVYAAWINDESKVMLHSLFNVPSEYFGTEADRLIMQISLLPVAITGSNVVDITRDFCLKVAGAIITFEVILQQVGPLLLNTEKPGSDEPFCIESD